MILIYHGNLEQNLYKFSIKIMQFPIYRWHLVKKIRSSGSIRESQWHGNKIFFEQPTWHLYTPLQLLKLSQIESGIVLMQYWGWPPLCFLFLLRRLSGDPTEIFSVEKRFPPLYERLMLRSTNQTSFHLKAAFSKIFDGWSSFFYL